MIPRGCKKFSAPRTFWRPPVEDAAYDGGPPYPSMQSVNTTVCSEPPAG